MQPITASPQRPQATRGRWIWVLTGTMTIVAIGTLGGLGIARAERGSNGPVPSFVVPVRTITVTQPVTALNVESYGAPIKVTTVPRGPVRIAEQIVYQETPPVVTDTVAHGLLRLAAPACAQNNCSVAFSVTVPSGVTVTAAGDGGGVTVVGTGAADIDSGGGPVYAANIGGPLTVNSEDGGVTATNAASADLNSGGGPVTAAGITGKLTVNSEDGGVTVSRVSTATIDSGGGPVYAASVRGALSVSSEDGGVTVSGAGATEIDSGGGPVTVSTINGSLGVRSEDGGVQANDVTGTLAVDTGGGPMSATGIASPSATVQAEDGGVTIGFVTAPTFVRVDTGGGDASLSVPGGPYAVTADTGDSGGPSESILVPTSSSATRMINVSTEGGNLQIGPA